MNPKLSHELDLLYEEHGDNFSHGFLLLLAALRAHDFRIARADETKNFAEPTDGLWPELSHPSVLVQATDAGDLARKLRETQAGSAEYVEHSNALIRANLSEQNRLLALLDEFYEAHVPVTQQARLIVETVDQGESLLRPQSASVRLIASIGVREKWLKEYSIEMLTFAKFMSDNL